MWSGLSAGSRRARCLVSPAAARQPLRAPCLADSSTGLGSLDSISASPCLLQSRSFHFPRSNWFPWRTRLIHDRQAALRKKRHILPRKTDPEERPIFYQKEDGNGLAFREKDLRIGMKRLLDYARLIRGRQLQDGIDWVESIARMKSEPILKMMQDAMQECSNKYKLDPARLFIFDAQPQRGKFVRELKKHARGNFGIIRRPRNYFMIRVREMPLEEFFHRIYVFNKVPRSMASDMRLALHQNRVSPQMRKEWAPYLSAHTRQRHRMELKWLDSTRQFDYYQARREWMQRYKSNLLRASAEAREARGLTPLPMAE
mmetsp:Transcript_61622/g.156640  ORF Transcript_61622/g.156640 Transcript_61622/m.156640 type:complete len:315 (+) Transcript_61622:99-1043(+)